MKDVIGRVIGVIDENGIIIACSELGKIGESKQRIKEELSFGSDFLVFEDYTYRFFGSAKKCEHIAFVEGDDQHANKMSQILAVALGNIKNLYDEKYDKNSFIKNIILDNILPSDIYIKSNELHFSNDEMRAVIVIKFQTSSSTPPYEIIQGMIDDPNRDYVINISEQDIVVVKEVNPHEKSEGLVAFANSIISKAKSEHSAPKVILHSSSLQAFHI